MNRSHPWFTGALIIPALILLLSPFTSAQKPEPEPVQPSVLWVTIDQDISGETVTLVNRGIREARSYGVRHLLLEITSNGGELAAIERVQSELRALKTSDVDTIAFIDGRAFSAAAMIAFNCDQIYMKEGSVIGAITPIQINPLTGEPRDIPKDVRRKTISAVQALVQTAIEGSKRDTPTIRLLLRAMVDPDVVLYDVTFKDRDGIETTTVVDEAELDKMRASPDKFVFSLDPQELKNRPLTLTADDANRYGLARVAESLEWVVENRLGFTMDQVLRLKVTWAENFATWLNDMRSVLFVLGFILLLIEMKTPGFALPGILGVIMFGLAFFGAYTAGLAEIGEVLLFFLGLGLLATEIFFFPGTVVFGLAGFVCIVSGLILSQQSFVIPANEVESDLMLQNFRNFGLILLVVMLGTWAIYANIHRIPILRSAVQTPPEPHAAGTGIEDEAEARLAQLTGHTGKVACDLRPAGWMEIDGERFDVVSDGSFIPKDSMVTVVEVRGNRVVVTRAGEQPAQESGQVDIPILIMLVLIGLALVVAEVFFVSFGVLAILSGVALVSAVFLAFAHHDTWVGFTFLISCAIGVPIAVKYAFKMLPYTPFGKHFYLAGAKHDEVSGGAQQAGLDHYLNKSGRALCDLRPAGFAEIEGRRVDVITRGEMLEKDSLLKVIRVETNQVVVALDEKQSN